MAAGPGLNAQRLAALIAAALLAGGCASPGTLRAFATDGCSLFPDGEVCACCVAHDMDYWRGGTAEQRRSADAALRDCVAARSKGLLPRLMYRAVRLGGTPWLPTGFRWAYGWGYGRGYEPLTPDEHRQAGQLLAAYRLAHPGLFCDRD